MGDCMCGHSHYDHADGTAWCGRIDSCGCMTYDPAARPTNEELLAAAEALDEEVEKIRAKNLKRIALIKEGWN